MRCFRGGPARHGQTEVIGVDLPALHAAVLHHAQASQVHWVSHSWGGVVMNSCLKRVTRWVGYLPARPLRIGSGNETRKTRRQIQAWVEAGCWVDDDRFDCGLAAQHVKLPPTLYLAAIDDPCRGNPEDVKRFLAESSPHLSRVHAPSKLGGAKHDCNHVSIVTHAGAGSDHFKLAEAWMQGRHDAVSERG